MSNITCKIATVKPARREFNNPEPVCGVDYRNGSIASLEEARLEDAMYAALAAKHDADVETIHHAETARYFGSPVVYRPAVKPVKVYPVESYMFSARLAESFARTFPDRW